MRSVYFFYPQVSQGILHQKIILWCLNSGMCQHCNVNAMSNWKLILDKMCLFRLLFQLIFDISSILFHQACHLHKWKIMKINVKIWGGGEHTTFLSPPFKKPERKKIQASLFYEEFVFINWKCQIKTKWIFTNNIHFEMLFLLKSFRKY